MVQYTFDKINFNKDEVIKTLNATIGEVTEERKKILATEIRNEKSYIENYKQYIDMSYTKIYRYQDELNSLNKIPYMGEFNKKALEHIEYIVKYPVTNCVTIDEKFISVKTKMLYITEPIKNKRYKLGEMTIKIPFKADNEPEIYNDTDTRNAYSLNMHHPHVFENGSACFGSFAPSITTAQCDREYFSLYLILLNFCRTVNIEDEAGRYIAVWDEVDKEGNIIKKGHELGTCSICGECYDDDEIYECQECGQNFCIDHIYTDTNGGVVLCENCYNEHYAQCEGCWKIIKNEDAFIVEGRTVCKDCYDSLYRECDVCGLDNQYETLIYDKVTDSFYCKTCYNNLLEKRNKEE